MNLRFAYGSFSPHQSYCFCFEGKPQIACEDFYLWVVKGKTLRTKGAKQPLIYLLCICQCNICIKMSKSELILATPEAETKPSVSSLCLDGCGLGPLGKSHEPFGLLDFICKGGSYIYFEGLLRIRKVRIHACYVCRLGLTVDTVVTIVDSSFSHFFLNACGVRITCTPAMR